MIAPFDLAKQLNAAVRAQMKHVKGADRYRFEIATSPAIAIDDQGLIRGGVFMKATESGRDLIYDFTAQATSTINSLDAKIVSISQYLGPYISVTVH